MSSGLLSPGELASMRTTVAQTFDGTAYILRNTQTADDIGGHSDAWGTAGTIACHLSPATIRSEEGQVAARITSEASKVLTCAGTVALTTKDRVREQGIDYEVLAVSTPRTYQLALRADLKEVD